jgi:hypothetical protein
MIISASPNRQNGYTPRSLAMALPGFTLVFLQQLGIDFISRIDAKNDPLAPRFTTAVNQLLVRNSGAL